AGSVSDRSTPRRIPSAPASGSTNPLGRPASFFIVGCFRRCYVRGSPLLGGLRMRIAVSVTMVLLLLGAAGAGDDAKAHLKRLQGKWQVTSATSRGEKVPAEDLSELELMIDGEKITIRDKDKVQDRMTCKVDPTKKP